MDVLSHLYTQLEAVEMQLAAWDKRCTGALTQIWDENGFQLDPISEHNQDHPEPLNAALRASGQTAEARVGLRPDGAVFTLLEDVSSVYMLASSIERATIRSQIRTYLSLFAALYRYIRYAEQHIQTKDDERWLQQGLIAASLLDQVYTCNFLDVLISLVRTATSVGIDPVPSFQSIGTISNTTIPQGELLYSTHDLLHNFHLW